MTRRILTILAMAGVAIAQTSVIDITDVVPRNRSKEPSIVSTSAGKSGGSTGTSEQESRVTTEILSAKFENGTSGPTLIFRVRLRNTSREKLAVPIDPNLAHFEPQSADTPYSYSSAHIFVLLEETKGVLQGVTLYGSDTISGSFAELAPGESIEIRARTPLTPVNSNALSPMPSRVSARAGIIMQRASVTHRDNSLREDVRQTGPEIMSVNSVVFISGS